MKNYSLFSSLLLLFFFVLFNGCDETNITTPNIIIINIDDLGYGDLSCYDSEDLNTIHVDRLAKEGSKFVNAYSTASICTPSRYSLLTGEYYWRKSLNWEVGEISSVGIAPGDAGMVIDTSQITIAKICKEAGYETGAVGKWHLGLGPLDTGPKDWNRPISPGPKEIGFEYSFILPATADRVPTVFFEIDRLVGIEENDPIEISYTKPIGPIGSIYNPNVTPDSIVSYAKDSPILHDNIQMHPSFGHDQTIVNGIPRIGYMSGAKNALWDDEELAITITKKALDFISKNKNQPFFLYFATNDVHVPRVPNKLFSGKSNIGVYGDVILQMDWSVGQILDKLDELNLTENTIVIFTSDNGPILNDGYFDGSEENIGAHRPSGDLRGSKYSAFEGGAKIPLIIRWPGKIKPGINDNLFSQVDILATVGKILNVDNPGKLTNDSRNQLDILIKEMSLDKRKEVVFQNMNGTLSLIQGDWKYIQASDGPMINHYTIPKTELGNNKEGLLFNLKEDPGELNDLAKSNSVRSSEMANILLNIINN